ADIYALGAILYEMLTSRPPFRGETTQDTLEQVRSHDPVSPSRLRPKLPCDLVTICLKCLQKEPHRRYATAKALAEDLRHFLTGEPIRARPIGLGEKAWKWSRRRPALTALALVSLAAAASLVAGGVWHTVQMGQALEDARQAEAHADQERRKAEGLQQQAELAAQQARDSAATALTVADFLAGIFQAFEPTGLRSYGFRSGGKSVADETAREILDRGALRVRTDLKNEPVIQAAMMDILGNVYRSLGEYDRAGELRKEGLAIRQRHFGEEHLDIAASLFHLGWLHHDLGSYEEAEQLYDKALAIRRKLLANDHLLIADTLFNLAWLCAHRPPDPNVPLERLAEAERLFREVLRIRREKLGNDHRDVAFTLVALAAVLYGRGDANLEALSLTAQAAAIFQAQEEPELTGTALLLFLKAQWARKAGKLEEAEHSYRQVLEMARRQLGDQHPITGMI